VNILPSVQVGLTQNLVDLQPRNHLYITAGVRKLGLDFALDTTRLADGYHELTAVAYEGSHARIQTRATLPAIIQNTFLNAILVLLDLTDPAPVEGTDHILVAANSPNGIDTITLCSTGGALESVTSQSTAYFQVAGPTLGAGLHPFYAVVRDVTGLSYRTKTKWVRLVRGQ